MSKEIFLVIQNPGLNTVCAIPRKTDSILLRCHRRAGRDWQRENLLMDVLKTIPRLKF